MKFSLFSAPITNKIPARSITLAECAELIGGISYQPRTSELRSLPTDEAKKYKVQRLDYVTFCGIFEKRQNDAIVKGSGLFCMDFDHVGDVATLKSRLVADKHFAARLCFVSPSGDGIKFVIEIDEEHTLLQWFTALYNYFLATYGLKIDKACKDVSRACFLCHDAEVWYDETCKPSLPFDVDEWAVGERKIADVRRDDVTIDERVEKVVRLCEDNGIDIAPSYEEWVTLGFALAEFGEGGRQYYHRLSRLHSEYDQQKTDSQYTHCLQHNGAGVTIASLFHLAKQYGVAIPAMREATSVNIIDVKDFLANHEYINKSAAIKEKLELIANEYYMQLSNTFSADELPIFLASCGVDGCKVEFEKNAIHIYRNKREVYINNLIERKQLERICCEKHIALLEDVLTEDFSFNFTAEELTAWIIDRKPQTIFRGYYYDQTAHCFRSEYGNEYYRIENEIPARLKNIYSSCLNYQHRDYKAIKEKILEITANFIQKQYLTKDMEYPDIRAGEYSSILGEKLKDFGKEQIYKFFHNLFTCTDDDIDSLILFVASTLRVHFFGDVKSYYCLLLTGDSGIGKDSFFPSFCLGMDYMDLAANDYLYKGSLFGTTRFSTISEESANKLLYNWISDDIEAANMVNKLDLINNPYFRIERKKKDPSMLVKRFNTAITANFKDVIFGRNYDPNAIVGRFLFAHFQYREGWERPQYVDFYVRNQERLHQFYKRSCAWIWQNVACNETLINEMKQAKLTGQKSKVSETIYKAEEDYQIYELFNEYYQQQQRNLISGEVCEYCGEKYVFVEGAVQMHNIFATMRSTPSAKKVSKSLALFFGEENVKYSQIVSRFGNKQRMALMVKIGISVNII